MLPIGVDPATGAAFAVVTDYYGYAIRMITDLATGATTTIAGKVVSWSLKSRSLAERREVQKDLEQARRLLCARTPLAPLI